LEGVGAQVLIRGFNGKGIVCGQSINPVIQILAFLDRNKGVKIWKGAGSHHTMAACTLCL